MRPITLSRSGWIRAVTIAAVCTAVLTAVIIAIKQGHYFHCFESWRTEGAYRLQADNGIDYTVTLFWRSRRPQDPVELKLRAVSAKHTSTIRCMTDWTRWRGASVDVVDQGLDVFPKRMPVTNELTGGVYDTLVPGLGFRMQNGAWRTHGIEERKLSTQIEPSPATTTNFSVLGAIVVTLFEEGVLGPRRFDSALWKAQSGSFDRSNPRGLMCRDLRQNHLRTGMEKEEILRLLGEPDHKKEHDSFKYVLGAWSGFRMDFDTLDVYFDSSGRVTKATVVQH